MANLPPAARCRVDAIPPAPQRRRIAFFAKAKRHTRVTAHFIRGFRQNQHHVLWINWPKIKRYLGPKAARSFLRWRLRRFRPHLALVYKTDAPADLPGLLPSSVPLALFYEDLFEEAGDTLLALARQTTALFITARGERSAFERAGAPQVFYLPTGCDRKDHFPVEPDRAYAGDVAFIGAANLPNRTELLRAIDERFALDLYGQGWEDVFGRRPRRRHVYPKQYRKICASTKCIIGIDKRNDIDLYFSNRTWLTLGCGGFLLTQYVPNLEELFTNHEHLVWFHSPEECIELIEHYLPREEERRRIAMAGCEYVRAYHTFRHATAEMVARTFGEPW